MTIETFDVALPHGITLSCRASGPHDAPVLMFVHGFPEAAFVWDGLLERLGDRWRCVAPNLRGYERSSRPERVEDYRPKQLMADIVALTESLGGRLDALIAHDWGGAVAWNLGAQRPELMRRLVIVNSPHPATFLRELKRSAAHQQASSYMNWLCRPDAAAKLAEDDFRRLWAMFDRPVPASWLDEATKAQYRAVWSAGLDGGLNYYRASPLKPPLSPDDAIWKVELPDAAVTVRVPTLVIWGERDIALLPSLLDGLEHWVPQLRLVRVPDATHWIVHEQPDRVAAELRRELG